MQWHPRLPGAGSITTSEDDYIVMPGEISFKKIEQCNTGRVFIVKFTNGRRAFYWLQDLKTDNDDENINKLNDILLNGVQAAGSSKPKSSAVSSTVNAPAVSSTPATTNVPATTTTAPSVSAPVSAPVISSSVPATTTTTVPATQAYDINGGLVHADISDIIGADVMTTFLNDPEVLAQLLPHLPAEQQNVTALSETFTSPQVQQAADQLMAVLQSEQMIMLMHQFGLPVDGSLGVNAFLEAIDKQAKKNKESKDSSSSNMDIDKK